MENIYRPAHSRPNDGKFDFHLLTKFGIFSIGYFIYILAFICYFWNVCEIHYTKFWRNPI